MLIYKKLDITTVQKGIVAHGVNCQWAMGAGVALAIKRKWPIVYDRYMWHKGKTTVNDVFGKVLFVDISSTLIVANCFTQKYYGNKAGVRYASPTAIKTSLESCVVECNNKQLDLYMPRIGCNLGGLSWSDDVQPVVEEISEKLDDKLIIYVCDY